jgi:DNA mismatch repair ATPase MutS
MFLRRKKENAQLLTSFGEQKDDYFNFPMIEKYFCRKDTSKAFQVISSKTCHDLDFNEVFAFVDRTHSKVGQQYLYNTLRTPNWDPTKNKRNERIIDKLTKDDSFRVSIQKSLGILNKYEAFHISSIFQEDHLAKPKWFFIVPILSLTSCIISLLCIWKPLFIIALLVVFIINLVVHFWNKRNLSQYIDSLPQLLRLNKVTEYLFTFAEFKELNPKLSQSIQSIQHVKLRMSFFQLELKLQGDFQIIAWALFELVKTLFLIEPLLLFGAIKRLDTKRAAIENVFEFVGQIDSLISIASLRKGLDKYCLPQLGEEINAVKAYHPLISNCTTNSIHFSDKSVLLTGSNMSGKTSFIRTIGINIITGFTINTCFASSFTSPLIKVHTGIRISDDLVNNKSYYFEEVSTIKSMIDESLSPDKNLFLLDEIYKGTNTIERISAGKAVLSMLSKNHNKVVVSTHDIELTELLKDQYELYHFSEVINDKSIGFDYKLKNGKLKNRNAIRILQMNNYPETVIKDALATANKMDATFNPKEILT